MGRSRSRSPTRKERRRSRSREKDTGRERDRDRRRRHRSRSPRQPGHRSRSRSPHRPSSPSYRRPGSPDNDEVIFLGTTQEPVVPHRAKKSKNQRKAGTAVEPVDVDADNDDADMMKLMGFSDFNTTKGKHVAGNDTHAAHIVQKRKYRQYMNRRGGFNRPLDYVA